MRNWPSKDHSIFRTAAAQNLFNLTTQSAASDQQKLNSSFAWQVSNCPGEHLDAMPRTKSSDESYQYVIAVNSEFATYFLAATSRLELIGIDAVWIHDDFSFINTGAEQILSFDLRHDEDSRGGIQI